MKGTVGTLPCSAAERGHQVTAPHALSLSRERFYPGPAQVPGEGECPLKSYPRTARRGAERREEGREAVLGVGLHIGLLGKTGACTGWDLLPPAPAVRLRPAGSFQRG